MILYMVGKLAPNSPRFTWGLVEYVPGRSYFRTVPSQNGDKFATSPTPPIVERLARAMYLCARVCILVQCLCSASLGQHGQCTYLPVVVLVLVPLVQCFAWTARAMYLCARACILVQCFVMGNPSHVRILVFGLSCCTCSATPTDMDSLLVMSRDGFYVRCICAGCSYLTFRGATVRLPVCTADREGGW